MITKTATQTPSRSNPNAMQRKGVAISRDDLTSLLAKADRLDAALPTSIAKDLATLNGSSAGGNPLNLRRVEDGLQIPVPNEFRFANVRVEIAGYSNAKLSGASGYKYDEMMKGLASKKERVGLLVSPTADPGSIDAAITGTALSNNIPLVSVTSEAYAKYIDPQKLGAGIPKEKYLAQPKYVLPDNEAYVKANAELSSALVAVGGGDVAGKAFRLHVEFDHPVALVDDGRGACLSVEALRSENASAWLADKVARHKKGLQLHSVPVNGVDWPYDLADAVRIGKEAAASSKANGTTVRDELTRRSNLPPEVFADALMFDKAGLDGEWFKANLDQLYLVRLTTIPLTARTGPEKAMTDALEFVERERWLTRPQARERWLTQQRAPK